MIQEKYLESSACIVINLPCLYCDKPTPHVDAPFEQCNEYNLRKKRPNVVQDPRSFDFVSMTEGKCVEPGGKLQIIFDTEKITKNNEIFNIWRKIKETDPKSIFLRELEWRSCDKL